MKRFLLLAKYVSGSNHPSRTSSRGLNTKLYHLVIAQQDPVMGFWGLNTKAGKKQRWPTPKIGEILGIIGSRKTLDLWL